MKQPRFQERQAQTRANGRQADCVPPPSLAAHVVTAPSLPNDSPTGFSLLRDCAILRGGRRAAWQGTNGPLKRLIEEKGRDQDR